MKSIRVLAAIGGALLVMGAMGTAAYADEDENTNVQVAENNASNDQACAAITGDAVALFFADADSGDAVCFNVSEQDQDIDQSAANQSAFIEDGLLAEIVPAEAENGGGDEMAALSENGNGGGYGDEDENTNVQVGENAAWSDQAAAAVTGDALAAIFAEADSGDALSFNFSEQDQDIDQEAANQSLFLED
jgi:hypothetical protein